MHQYELAAQIATYAETPTGLVYQAETMAVLGAVVNGDLSEADVLHSLGGLTRNEALPYADWLAHSDAETEAAIAARVALQATFERYEDEVLTLHANPPRQSFGVLGRHFDPYLLTSDEEIVVKLGSSTPARNLTQVHHQTSALIRSDELHPALEQPVASSYKYGIVMSERIPGKLPPYLDAEEVLAVTPEMVADGMEAAVLAAHHRLGIDPDGHNINVDPTAGFGFFDLVAEHVASKRELILGATEIVARDVVYDLGRYRAQGPAAAHHRQELYTYARQLAEEVSAQNEAAE
ncbi:MAG TPA: hypothetical protein VJP80_07980 [Candidatus Saccharimonadales bacterium]|nr:hypothetical protein [Candidatus Saccharimonadales bacterium]